jgi:ribonuclease P protein subunit POP4
MSRGLSGIVIHETENTFKIISIFAFAMPFYSTLPASYKPNDALPIPDPDSATTTVLQVPHMEFELHGNQFRFRAAERAGRKFKDKETVEL